MLPKLHQIVHPRDAEKVRAHINALVSALAAERVPVASEIAARIRLGVKRLTVLGPGAGLADFRAVGGISALVADDSETLRGQRFFASVANKRLHRQSPAVGYSPSF